MRWAPAALGLFCVLAVAGVWPARAAVPAPVASIFGDAPLTAAEDAAGYHALADAADAAFDDERWQDAAEAYEDLVARFPADASHWGKLGWACYNLGRYARAAEAYAVAVDLGTTFPNFSRYNRACCLALLGDGDGAVAELRQALAAGMENRNSIREDGDFASLHDRPDWAEVAGLLPDSVQGRDAGWRYDLDFLVQEIRRLHPAPFRVTPEAEFMRRVDELRRRIPDLSDEQVAVELHKLTVLLGDGHSGVRPIHGSQVAARALPLQLYAFADGLFVIDAPAERLDLVGAEVLAIGTRNVDEMWRDVPALVPSDSRIRVLQQGPFVLTLTSMLRNLGALADTEDVPLRIRDREGVERGVTVASAPLERPNLELIASKAPGAAAPPLYLAREDEVAWFGPVGDGPTLFVQLNVVRDGPDETLAAFAHRLGDHLAGHPEIRDVVLDVRHNSGGNSFLYPPLVRALVAFEQRRADARIFVIMGRQTFSACQNLVTDLAWWTDAIFVGEPSGSAPNAIGESTWSLLPYSGLRAGVSSRFHQQSYPGDERAWISPDVPVALTSADYFANRDPALEAVLEIIAGAPAHRGPPTPRPPR